MATLAWRILVILASVIAIDSSAGAQLSTSSDGLRAAVVLAAAEALGAAPDEVPSYLPELKMARTQIDVAFFCTAKRPLNPLSDDLNAKIVSRAFELLKQGDFVSTVNERPAFVVDLLVTAVAAFELGRVISISDVDGKKLCPPTPAQAQ